MKAFAGRGLVRLAALQAVCSCGLLLTNRCWFLLVPLLGITVALALADYRRLRRYAGSVEAELSVPQSVQRGEPIVAVVRIRNTGPEPLEVRVRPVLPELGSPHRHQAVVNVSSKSAVELTFTVEASVRGQYCFRDLFLRLSSPRAMLQAQICIPNTKVCKVLPHVDRVREYLMTRRVHAMTAPHLRTAPFRGIGSEFESLRDYEQGDDIRRIDWRSTAKRSKLITRNYEIEPFRNVLVIVDRGRLMAAESGDGTKLDCAVDAALMLTAVALDSGDRCGLLVFDNDVVAYLPPRGTLRQLTHVVDTLYDVQPVLDESHFLRAFALVQSRLSKRSLIIALTDVIDIDVSGSTLGAMLSLSKRHLVVVAALRTPAAYEVIAQPVTDRLDPFRKAAAYRLAKERREVMSHLRKGGVHVLDVHPEELTLPLVNKYIELREQNRL